MRTVSCLRDIEQFGIFLLTGEACNLYMRCLCDYSERGRRLLGKRFGVVDFQGGEPWNTKTGNEAHVGSVMLAYDDWKSLGVLGLLLTGSKWALETGYVTNPVHDVVRLMDAARKAVEATEGVDIAEAMAGLKETVASTPNYRGSISPGTVYGFSRDEEEAMNGWIEMLRSRGMTVRVYTGSGHPHQDFRNQHQMSGRIE